MLDYGAPDLRINRSWKNVNGSGQPFITCTTCHNQHIMTIFVASVNNPIEGNTSGYYTTFFFIDAPYDPDVQGKYGREAPDTAQFCRQCHFVYSNEANDTNNITTVF